MVVAKTSLHNERKGLPNVSNNSTDMFFTDETGIGSSNALPMYVFLDFQIQLPAAPQKPICPKMVNRTRTICIAIQHVYEHILKTHTQCTKHLNTEHYYQTIGQRGGDIECLFTAFVLAVVMYGHSHNHRHHTNIVGQSTLLHIRRNTLCLILPRKTNYDQSFE